MLVARICPPDSALYEKWRIPIGKLGAILDTFAVIRLFVIWSLTVTGTVLASGLEDRFLYWNWTTWTGGLLRLVISSLLFLLLLHPKSLWIAGSRRLNESGFAVHGVLALLFILIGGIGYTTDQGTFLLNAVPYVIGFTAGLLVFQFTLTLDESKGEWSVERWDHKITLLGISCLLFGAAVLLGFYFDDPILSTVAMVNIPFSLVAMLFSSHVRHLQRARFYPLFIFSLFLCVRAPWFFIPLAVLFFTLRTINYFRFGIVFPSFGVDFDEASHYV